MTIFEPGSETVCEMKRLWVRLGHCLCQQVLKGYRLTFLWIGHNHLRIIGGNGSNGIRDLDSVGERAQLGDVRASRLTQKMFGEEGAGCLSHPAVEIASSFKG